MSRLPALALIALAACGGGEELDPDAYYWDVSLLGTFSTCHDDDNVVGYAEDFTYGLSFDGSATTLRIDGNTFASGLISGCSLDYESGVVGQDRPGGFVQWQLLGEALIETGGDGCSIPDIEGTPLDWYGTETFVITYSEDPALAEGCEYEMSVQGVYVEQ